MFLQISEIQAKLRKDYTLVEGIKRRELDFKILYDLEKVTNGQFVGHACLISLACWVNYSFIPLLWVEHFMKIKKWYLSVYSSGFHLFVIHRMNMVDNKYLFMIKHPIECSFFLYIAEHGILLLSWNMITINLVLLAEHEIEN